MLLATDSISGDKAINWEVGKPHPFVSTMKVIAMYVNGALVEIYSVSMESREGMRDLVPLHRTRIIREAMPIEIWAEELAAAEAGPDDDPPDPDDDEPDDEPEPGTAETVPPPVNGQSSP